MNIKPGSVNQQPLYGCTSCYEDYTWPASDLRVYDGECWCDLCWDERRWEFPDLPYWDDLEPYTPALQPAEQPAFTVGTDLSDGELSVVVMKHENNIALVIHSEVIPLAQQPLTDEHKAILKECRNQAMKWTLEARIPESGVFGGIAQDLDYLCGQLGVEND